jgi:hypothetical protein
VAAAQRFESEIRGEAKMTEPTKSACVSRRTVLIAAAGAAPLLAMSATGARAAKMAQAAVRYQATPKDGKECSGCNLFMPPNACKSVDGTIAPTGWCALWVKKAG